MANAAPGIPAAAGSAASPAQGQMSGFGEIMQGLGQAGDIMRQHQLLKAMQEQQMYQTTQYQRDAEAQAIQNDPSQATNPDLLRQVQRSYQGTGVQAPIGNMPQQTAQGDQVAGQGWDAKGNPNAQMARGVDPTMLTGQGNFYTFVQKNLPSLQGTPPEQRAGVAMAEGIHVSPQQEQMLKNLPYQLPPTTQEKMSSDVEKGFTTRFNAALKGGNSPAAIAAVHSAYQQYLAIPGMTKEQADNVFGPYMEQGIADLSPLQVAQLAKTNALAGKDSEDTQVMQQMLQPRIDEMNARNAQLEDESANLRQRTAVLKTLMPGQLAHLAASTTLDLNLAAAALDRGAEDVQMGEYYGQRVQQLKAGGNPAELNTAMRIQGNVINNSQTVIGTIMNSNAKLAQSMTQALPNDKPGIQKQIDAGNAMIQIQTDRMNQAQQTLQSLGNNMMVNGMPFSYPGAGNSAPPPPAANPGQSAAKTEVNPKNGKTYYLHPDGKYYLTPPT